MARLGLGCFPPAPGSVASSLARAEAAWLQGDRHAVAKATEGTLPLALERKWWTVAGELAAWRRRAGLDDEIPAETAEPYVLQLAGDWARAAEHWRDLGCPYEAALAPTDADEEEPLRRALDELERLGARPAADIVVRRLRELVVRRLPRRPRRQPRRAHGPRARGAGTARRRRAQRRHRGPPAHRREDR